MPVDGQRLRNHALFVEKLGSSAEPTTHSTHPATDTRTYSGGMYSLSPTRPPMIVAIEHVCPTGKHTNHVFMLSW
jgi:hypothetical protein